MQWNIRSFLILTAIVGGLLSIVRAFWVPNIPNYQILLAIYLLVLTALVVSTVPTGAKFRGGLIGAVLFGIAFLVLVLKGGLAVQSMVEGVQFVRDAYLGFLLWPIAFLLSHLLTTIIWPTRQR